MTAAAAPARLFAAGALRHTLLLAIMRDLAGASREDALALLDRMPLRQGFDVPFFELVANELDRDPDASLAEIALLAARSHAPAAARGLLERVVELALAERRLQLAATYAEQLSSELDVSPLMRARCLLAIGSQLLARGDSEAAQAPFAEGAEWARKADDPGLEWELTVSVTAARQLAGEFLGALESAERAVELARADGRPQLLSKALGDRGNAELALRRAEPARLDYEEALAAATAAGDEAARSDWLGNLGTVHGLLGDLYAAAAAHEQALAISRSLGGESLEQDLANLAGVRWRQERWDDAVSLTAEAVAVAEARGSAETAAANRRALAAMYQELGRYAEAGALAHLVEDDDEAEDEQQPLSRHVFERPPEDPELDEAIGAALQVRDVDRVFHVIDEYIARDPANPLGHVKRGMVLQQTGRPEEALAAYERAIELSPRWSVPHVNAVNAWGDLRRLDECGERYEQMVADDPYDPLPRLVLGRVYGAARQHVAALRELREAKRLAPGDFEITLELACELEAGTAELLEQDWAAAWARFDECAAVLDELASLDPERRPLALATAGQMYLRFAEASARVNPTLRGWMGDRELRLWVRAVVMLAEAVPQLDSERFAQLLSYALDLLVNIGDDQTFLETALTFERLGHEDLAVTFFERAVADNPRSVEARYLLARLLAHRPGERQRALELLEQVVTEEPEHADAVGLLRRLRHEQGP